MAAELQRTNPAELLYAEDFAEMSLIEGRRGCAVVRCGNSKLIPRASS
jgi:DNA mismatch repair ATPase MutS